MSGHKLRQGYGSRGSPGRPAKSSSRTQDGRLIALDGKSGQPIWTAQTVAKDDNAYISARRACSTAR